jgi:hypothetical protein
VVAIDPMRSTPLLAGPPTPLLEMRYCNVQDLSIGKPDHEEDIERLE